MPQKSSDAIKNAIKMAAMIEIPFWQKPSEAGMAMAFILKNGTLHSSMAVRNNKFSPPANIQLSARNPNETLCQNFALTNKMSTKYAEGFYISRDSFAPISHAWSTNKNGTVTDYANTPNDHLIYFGYAFDHDIVKEHLSTEKKALRILTIENMIKFDPEILSFYEDLRSQGQQELQSCIDQAIESKSINTGFSL